MQLFFKETVKEKKVNVAIQGDCKEKKVNVIILQGDRNGEGG